jgi:hypothetical protein
MNKKQTNKPMAWQSLREVFFQKLSKLYPKVPLKNNQSSSHKLVLKVTINARVFNLKLFVKRLVNFCALILRKNLGLSISLV